jgi:RNA polymerase sigma-70 factor (ECF subfamily)
MEPWSVQQTLTQMNQSQAEPDPPTDATRRERFYREVWPEAAMLMRTAISMCHDNAEAEDLVQDTLLKAFKALDQLQPGSHPKAWLLTTLRRTWIDRWRKASRRPDGEAIGLDLAPEPEITEDAGQHNAAWADPESILQRFGDQEVIDALRLLPEGNRWALLLVDVQSLSIEEAAEVLEVAPGTVKSRLHRGRAMLRERLHDFARDRGWVQPRTAHPLEKNA